MIAGENYFMEMEITVPKGRTWRAAQGTRCSQAHRPGTYPHSSRTKFLICELGMHYGGATEALTGFKQQEEKQASHLGTC